MPRFVIPKMYASIYFREGNILPPTQPDATYLSFMNLVNGLLIVCCRSREGHEILLSRGRYLVRRIMTWNLLGKLKQMYSKDNKKRCQHMNLLDYYRVPRCIKNVTCCSGWPTGCKTGQQRFIWLSTAF